MIAFATRTDPPGLELRVNFGVFAGREATAAELDDLASALIPDVGEVSVIAEHRHEFAEESEVSVHQVRVEVAEDRLPANGHDREAMTERLLERAAWWAESCIAERHAEVTEA